MKKLSHLFIFLLFPISLFASTNLDVGFLKGSVWASKDDPFVGEEITLYTVLYNGSDGVLTGKVQFLDSEIILGERDISIPEGEVEDVSIAWTAGPGSHTFSTRLLNGIVSKPGDEDYHVPFSDSQGSEKYTVSVKQKPIPVKAQASEDPDAGLHLDKIDSLQDDLNNIIPESLSDKVSEYTKGVEVFREKQSDSFIKKREELNKEMNEKALEGSEFKGILTPTKDTTVDELLHPEKKVAEAIKTPWSYVKLFILGVLIFVFKSPVVFYVVSIALAVLIIRLVIRKIKRS